MSKPRTKKTTRSVGVPTRDVKARLDKQYGKSGAITEIKRGAGAGAGRPTKAVDPRVLAGLCAIQCTLSEMAAVLGVDPNWLSQKYSALIEAEREAGKMSIRRAQFTSALNGNVVMLRWLGIQYLGQKDKMENSAPPGELPLLVFRQMAAMPSSAGVDAALDQTRPLA